MTTSIPESTMLTVEVLPENNKRTGTATELKMIAGPDVFTPLHDTSLAFKLLEDHLDSLSSTSGLKIADFGSGTGQFAVWTKNLFPDTDVHAYDIDPNTEKYINANAELYNVDITTHIMDVDDIANTEKFDAIISTPPFFPEALKKLEHTKLDMGIHLDDPDISKFGGLNGLQYSKVFIEKAGKTLKSGGILVSVHSILQGDNIDQMLRDNGFENILRKPTDIDSTLITLCSPSFTIAFKK